MHLSWCLKVGRSEGLYQWCYAKLELRWILKFVHEDVISLIILIWELCRENVHLYSVKPTLKNNNKQGISQITAAKWTD